MSKQNVKVIWKSTDGGEQVNFFVTPDTVTTPTSYIRRCTDPVQSALSFIDTLAKSGIEAIQFVKVR